MYIYLIPQICPALPGSIELLDALFCFNSIYNMYGMGPLKCKTSRILKLKTNKDGMEDEMNQFYCWFINYNFPGKLANFSLININYNVNLYFKYKISDVTNLCSANY